MVRYYFLSCRALSFIPLLQPVYPGACPPYGRGSLAFFALSLCGVDRQFPGSLKMSIAGFSRTSGS